MNTKSSNTELELYRQPLFDTIERIFGSKIQVSSDFVRLGVDIKYRTGKDIGLTTLKRIYGYINDSTETRRTTLDILSVYVGYRDWESFKEASKSSNLRDSGFITSRHLVSETLTIGSLIRLIWHPERICICQYRGQNTFVVVRSEQTRISAGTTFQCAVFVAGKPAVLDHVCIAGSDEPVLYSIGSKFGIQFDILTPL